jgi:hypothetical protein
MPVRQAKLESVVEMKGEEVVANSTFDDEQQSIPIQLPPMGGGDGHVILPWFEPRGE